MPDNGGGAMPVYCRVGRTPNIIGHIIMSDADKKQDDERRTRKERRKSRLLPYFGKDRRKGKVVREADVMEIYIPPLKETQDRRGDAKDGSKTK